MKERCPTKLLADTPAETDAFGSHERVARSIAEVVQTESGGKAIGLEGGWGAGKSTIVKLISQKLSHTRESAHEIAVFDMWSHQDDPLRRTFLESLITRVQGFGWVNKEKWDQRIAELARRPSRRYNQNSAQTDSHRSWVRLYPTGHSYRVSSNRCWTFASGLQGCLSDVGSRASSGRYNHSTRSSYLLRRGPDLENNTQGLEK